MCLVAAYYIRDMANRGPRGRIRSPPTSRLVGGNVVRSVRAGRSARESRKRKQVGFCAKSFRVFISVQVNHMG
jgi:hypothetical protein